MSSIVRRRSRLVGLWLIGDAPILGEVQRPLDLKTGHLLT
jgi:hypothetical protein